MSYARRKSCFYYYYYICCVSCILLYERGSSKKKKKNTVCVCVRETPSPDKVIIRSTPRVSRCRRDYKYNIYIYIENILYTHTYKPGNATVLEAVLSRALVEVKYYMFVRYAPFGLEKKLFQ